MDLNLIDAVGDRYVVEIYRAANESSSGLLMENNSNVSAAPVLGTILKVGNRAKEDFKVGDQIFFRRYSIDELKVITKKGEQTIYIVEGNDVVGVIRSNKLLDNIEKSNADKKNESGFKEEKVSNETSSKKSSKEGL